jgi:hypothetical protein
MSKQLDIYLGHPPRVRPATPKLPAVAVVVSVAPLDMITASHADTRSREVEFTFMTPRPERVVLRNESRLGAELVPHSHAISQSEI